jgi:integrase
MPLSDTALRALKPTNAEFKKADGGGLFVVVKPTGARIWRLAYRFFGKQKTLTIGHYPAVSLVDARAARENAKKLLSQDIDPGVQKQVAKAAAEKSNAETFEALADEFLANMVTLGRSQATIDKNKWMLKEVARPLAKRPMKQITSPETFALLNAIEKSGRRDTAIATRAAISRVFRLAILSGRAETDPTYALRGALTPPTVVSHPAIVEVDQVGGLVRAIRGYTGWPTLRGVLMMQAVAFARPSETRTMNIAEIDFKKAIWTIPKEKTKMRRPQGVPLSRQALTIIEEMKPHMSDDGDVFPSMMSGKRFLSENAMNSALRRMGFTSDEHTAHGFRSTASTLLNGSGLFSSDAIEAQLAHLDKDKVRRIYNRWEYWEERVTIMQWWADYLDERAKDRA